MCTGGRPAKEGGGIVEHLASLALNGFSIKLCLAGPVCGCMLDSFQRFPGSLSPPQSPQEGSTCVQKGACHPGCYESYIFLLWQLRDKKNAPLCLDVIEL